MPPRSPCRRATGLAFQRADASLRARVLSRRCRLRCAPPIACVAVAASLQGAFVPGLAVAPIVMRFRCPGVSPGWVGPHSFGVHLVRMFMQWKLKTITTTCLPLYRPSDAEKADPELYSRNVQRYMADALGVPACQDWGIEESRALYSVLDENYAKSS